MMAINTTAYRGGDITKLDLVDQFCQKFNFKRNLPCAQNKHFKI